MRRRCGLSVLLLPLFGIVGCAPTRFTDAIGYVAEQHHVRDASALCVAGMGHLRFDAALRSDLDDAVSASELQTVKVRGADVLRRANELAIASVDGEIDRMPAEGLETLANNNDLASSADEESELRDYLKREFASRAGIDLEQDQQALVASNDLSAARGFLKRIRGRIEPHVGDRGKVGRVLLGAPLFIPATIGADIADREATQRAVVADFERVTEYRPANADQPTDADTLEHAEPARLAELFAPVFEQQSDPQGEYPPADDMFGRVYLTGTPDDIQVHVDVDDPVVYWAHQQAKVGERKYDQLVYAAWYPNRPALTENDPDAGRIDGVVVRITLDRHERPAVYEFVRSCGCYHTLWVSEFVESAAREQFGSPHEGMTFAVQRPTTGRELFFPDLIRDDGSHPRRPLAFVSAGYHLLMTVRPFEEEVVGTGQTTRRTYRLEPYDSLTRLPLGDGVASMFGSDGLVHDAGRSEGWLLAPTGMLSAGQPRQLGTMRIRMDEYDYDDPRLLDRNLRLPSGF